MTGDRTPVGPVQQSPSFVGTESFRIRCDADTAQIEAIGIPADLKRDVAVGVPVRVQPAGLEEQLKIRIVEVEERTAERTSVFAAAEPVFVVVLIVDAAGIAEESE